MGAVLKLEQHQGDTGHRRVETRPKPEKLAPHQEDREAGLAIDARHAGVVSLHERAEHTLERARSNADAADLKEIDEVDREIDALFKEYDAAFAELRDKLYAFSPEEFDVYEKGGPSFKNPALERFVRSEAKKVVYENRDKKAKKEAFHAHQAELDAEERSYVAQRSTADTDAHQRLFAEAKADHDRPIAHQKKQIEKEIGRSKAIAEDKKLSPEAFAAKQRARVTKALEGPQFISGNDITVADNQEIRDHHRPKTDTDFDESERTQIDAERYYASDDFEAGANETRAKIEENWERALAKQTPAAKESSIKEQEEATFAETKKYQKEFQAGLVKAGLDTATIATAGSLFDDVYNGHVSADQIAASLVLLSARGVDNKQLAAVQKFIKKYHPASAPSADQIGAATKRIGAEALAEEEAEATAARAAETEKKQRVSKTLKRAGEAVRDVGEKALKGAMEWKHQRADAQSVDRVNARLKAHGLASAGRAQEYARGVAATDAKDQATEKATKKEWDRLFHQADIAYNAAAGRRVDELFGYEPKASKPDYKASRDAAGRRTYEIKGYDNPDVKRAGYEAAAEVFAMAGKSLRDVEAAAQKYNQTTFAEKYMPSQEHFDAAPDKLTPPPKPTLAQRIGNAWRDLWK